MRKVEIKKLDLLVKLQENRHKHVAAYNQAVVDFKEASLLEIERKKKHLNKLFVDLIKKVESEEKPVQLYINGNLSFDISPPVSNEEDYSRLIAMFEMEVNDTVELDSTEFSQYVLDDWKWKQALENQTLMYASKKF